MKSLIVGGEINFVRNVLTKHLAEYGIEVLTIWDWDHAKPIAKIPTECDCVIVVKDMTGHTQRNVARQLAKRQGVMFIEIPRKWSVAKKHLEALNLIPNKDKESSTVSHMQGEDFAATFSRVVERSYQVYKETKGRPNPKDISNDLGIPTWHLAMQKGISTGVAKANGEDFNAAMICDKGWNLNEMVEMCLNDYPEMIRDKNALSTFLSELCEKKNNRNFQKRVKTIATQLRKRWVRSSRRANTHPDRIYIDGLKLKWFEEHARKFYEENESFPEFSKSNVQSRSVFDSQLTRTIFDTVVNSLKDEIKEEAANATEPVQTRSEKIEAEDVVTHTVAAPAEVIVEPTTVEDNLIPAILHFPDTGKKKRTHGKVVKSQSLRESIAKYFDMLGKVHDDKVAKLAGCSTTSIRRFRLEMGIPRYQRSVRQEAIVERPVAVVGQLAMDLQPDGESVVDETTVHLNTFDSHSGEGDTHAEQIDKLTASVENLDGKSSLVLETLRELVVKIVELESTIREKDERIAVLEGQKGRVSGTPSNLDSLGTKVDGLINAGFKVKLEVTTE